MGIYDRQYIRFGRGADAGVGAMQPLSVNAWLIIVNVAVFLLDGALFNGALLRWLHFSTARAFFGLEVWRFVGFQFLHANFTHLFFNMLGLFFFGGLVEGYLGRRRYLAFYLLCGVAGALLYLLLNLLGQFLPGVPFLLFNDIRTPLIGASAGVFGVLMAAARIAPNAMILVFFLIPMRLATAVYLFIALVVLNLFTGGPNAGGDAAHLGGAIAGWFFIRHPHLLRDFFEGLPFLSSSSAAGQARRSRPLRRPNTPSDEEIDRILAKVATQGLHSLTNQERKILQRATEARRRV